jgi:hypothetical protein
LHSYLKTNNNVSFFSKMKGRKIKQVLSGGWYQWERKGENIRER